MTVIKTLFALTCALPLIASAELQVEQAWIPEAPPTAQALGAFMVFNNTDEQPISIVSATAPNVDRVELHLSTNENGMHKMVAQEKLVVPANGKLELKPGSYHIMLIGVQQTVKAGDVIPMTVTTESGKVIAFDAVVHKRKDMMKMMGTH